MNIKFNINSHIVSVFLLAILCIFLLSPYVERTIGETAFFLLSALYLVLEINSLLNKSGQVKRNILSILVYIFIIYIYKLIGLSTASVLFHYNVVKFFLAFIFILPIFQKLSKNETYFLLIIALGTMFITMAQNFALKASFGFRYSIQLYNTSGIAEIVDTQYTTAILLVTGGLFCCFLKATKAWTRVFLLISVVYCIYFNLVVTQRGIIFFLLIIMIPLLILFNSRFTRTRAILNLFVIVVLIVAALEYRAVLTWVGSIIGSARLTTRINQVIRAIEMGSIQAGEGSLAARFQLIGVSISTTFASMKNFLMGVGNRTDSYDLVGGHSQFFDEFAKYGVLIGTFSCINVQKMLKNTYQMLGFSEGDNLKGQFIVLILIMLLRAMVGGIFEASVGAAAFIIIPLLFKLLISERRNRIWLLEHVDSDQQVRVL